MIKKLSVIGIAIMVGLLAASSARADILFYGGDMTGTMTINPTASLDIPVGGPIVGSQGLTAADVISFATTGCTGTVTGASQLHRSVSGTIGSLGNVGTPTDPIMVPSTTTDGLQFIAANDPAVGISAGRHQTITGIYVQSTDRLDTMTGGVSFGSNSGWNPAVTVAATGFTQVLTADTPGATTPAAQMIQTNATTYALTSPGTAGSPLFTQGTGSGTMGFTAAIQASTFQQQEFSDLIVGNVGMFDGFQSTTGRVNITGSITAAQ